MITTIIKSTTKVIIIIIIIFIENNHSDAKRRRIDEIMGIIDGKENNDLISRKSSDIPVRIKLNNFFTGLFHFFNNFFHPKIPKKLYRH